MTWPFRKPAALPPPPAPIDIRPELTRIAEALEGILGTLAVGFDLEVGGEYEDETPDPETMS